MYKRQNLNHPNKKNNRKFREKIEEIKQVQEEKQVKEFILKIRIKQKWILAQEIVKITTKRYLNEITELVHHLQVLDKKIKKVENKRLGKVMKTVDVVAMTTTGACKYRKQLQKVGAKIILIEEAAEVLEAQIVTSLSKKTQQLILIGDHQQLKPKVNSYILGNEYNLSISLFERFVLMGIPKVSLKKQRRMRPKISNIMRLIYSDLKDHESVEKYDSIR